MVATGIVYCQIYYSINRSPGFDKDNLLVVEDLTRPEVSPQRKALTQQLHSLANVSDVTLSSERPMRSGGNQLPVTVPAGNSKVGSTSEQPILVTYMVVGYNFFETYRMKLLTGRFYNESFPGDVLPRAGENYSGEILQGSVIINEKAAQTLGFSSPNDAEGRLVRSYVGGSATGPVSADLKIVGVIGDAQFRNMQATAAPTMYYLSPQSNSLSVATIRYRGEESEILKLVANVWGTVVGDHILASAFVDSEISTQFVQENRELKMLTGFSLLAICIACLGLFGVASYVVERRTKEVGLRKVMGAKIRQIVRLVTWEFSKPILWANLMAWPIAVIVMTYWLEQFASRVDIFIFVPLCLGAGVLSMVVACLTVFGSVNRVAKMKPADSLRYE
jgi:putative ABC transport system permease protein